MNSLRSDDHKRQQPSGSSLLGFSGIQHGTVPSILFEGLANLVVWQTEDYVGLGKTSASTWILLLLIGKELSTIWSIFENLHQLDVIISFSLQFLDCHVVITYSNFLTQ